MGTPVDLENDPSGMRAIRAAIAALPANFVIRWNEDGEKYDGAIAGGFADIRVAVDHPALDLELGWFWTVVPEPSDPPDADEVVVEFDRTCFVDGPPPFGGYRGGWNPSTISAALAGWCAIAGRPDISFRHDPSMSRSRTAEAMVQISEAMDSGEIATIDLGDGLRVSEVAAAQIAEHPELLEELRADLARLNATNN